MAWEVKKLGDVCEIVNGGTPDTKVKEYWDGKNLWITPKDMGKLNSRFVEETGRKITDSGLKKSSAKLLPINSIILSSRAPIGHLAINKKPISTNQGCKGIVPNKSLDYLFLYYFLINSVKLLNSLGTGTTFKELSSSKLANVQIPIPSLSEQKRIATILDEAFEKISKVKENAKKNLNNAKEVFESYLQSVFENKGEGWEEKRLGDVCDLMTGGTPSKSNKEYFEQGKINWLVSGDVNLKEITRCNGRITESGLKNSNAKYLPLNSVIIALNGQGKTRGTVAMLRIKATCNQSLVSIYPKNPKIILSEYIYHNLDSRYDEIRKITGDSGNDRRGLNMPLIRSINISYPTSIDQQKKYIVKFKEFLKNTQKLEAIYAQKLTELEELKQSILQKAFEGKLTEVSA